MQMTNDECGMTNARRRDFLKQLVGLSVAPLVPVPEVPPDTATAGWRPVEIFIHAPKHLRGLKLWLGKQKTEEMREHLLEGKPLPMRCHYGFEFDDETEGADDDDD